ncbi:MAG: integrase domain-containing protein [Deltaproteobacteria bacterium]|nr:integrase domain-containing protein [Deltaproteobacteria bacterium]
MKGLERNFSFYASQAGVRLRDNMHELAEKSKFNIRTEATAIARDLIEIGYNRNGTAKNMTEQDIRSLVQSWQDKGLAVGTMQNKMTTVRQILSAADNKLPISNVELGISQGRDVLNSANINKACSLPSAEKLSAINDKTLSGAILLSAAYGLRRDESLYVVHALTLRHSVSENNKLIIPKGKGKGTVARTFEMRDGGATLRAVAQSVAGLKTYVNIDRSRIENFRNRLENEVRKIDGLNMHGLRHNYIQERYLSLTGLIAPAAGGLKYENMTDVQKENYHSACNTISPESGHTRETIIRSYIGK